jgi:hypothetical protein
MYFTRDRSSDILLTSDVVSSKTSKPGDLFSILQDLDRVKFTASIFNNPIFTRRDILKDHSVTLTTQEPGRTNPFAPLPGLSTNTTVRGVTAGQ